VTRCGDEDDHGKRLVLGMAVGGRTSKLVPMRAGVPRGVWPRPPVAARKILCCQSSAPNARP
jgi:hypothetical protein